MPHLDLKYSADIALDAGEVLRGVEEIIQRHDAGSGACKGRAYPAPVFQHRHLIAEISLLPKAHRDAAFMAALRDELADYLRGHLPRPCAFSLDLRFSGEHYLTEMLE